MFAFFNSFATSKCFFLLDVTFKFKFFSFSSKFISFTELAISLLVAKFACANLGANFFAVSLLNFGVTIYLS